MLIDIVRLLRPHHYTKNLFIFLPAFFSFKLGDTNLLLVLGLTFIAFSLVASSIYVLNDYIDKNEDATHPTKSSRPIASGKINGPTAITTGLIIVSIGLLLGSYISSITLNLLLFYILMNVAYSLRLKHIPIIDLMVISLGFVIRLLSGSISVDIFLSKWVIVITFLLSLFLALAKRRDDVLVYERSKIKPRKVLDSYNLKLVDALILITASTTILAYILWSLSNDAINRLQSEYLYITSFFVILGVFRYLQITFVFEKSGSPTNILISDSVLQMILLSWILSFVYILY